MLIAISSCWHLHGDNLPMRIGWVRRALSNMKDSGVQAILHCGDMFHYGRIGSKDAPAPAVIDALRDAVEEFGIPVFLVEGNHDQNDAPHPSATRIIDRCPRFAYMGAVPYFELPVAGFEGVYFLGCDWHPSRGTDAFLETLKGRMDMAFKAGARQLFIYGHLDLLDISHGASPEVPRPTAAQLNRLVHDLGREMHEVNFTFGHIHGAQWVNNVRIIGALMRLRWDEKDNQDGWDLVWRNGRAIAHTRVPLNGPRYLVAPEFLPEGVTVGGWVSLQGGWRPGDVVRVTSAVDVGEPPPGVTVDVVRPAAERRIAPTRATDLYPGMSPEEALSIWLAEQEEEDEETLLPACRAELDRLRAGEGTARGYGVGVTEVVDVQVLGHVCGDLSVKLRPDRWNVLLGPSGSGKTTLLEATFAGLFGNWPSPYRSNMWAGFDSEKRMQVASQFRTVNETYTVQRAKHKENTSLIVFDDRLTPLTEQSKPTKTQPLVFSLAGDPQVWLRTCFLCQDAKPDLVESTPAERHSALQRILGLDEIEPLYLKASQELKRLQVLKKNYDLHLSEAGKAETEHIEQENIRVDCEGLAEEVKAKIKRAEAKLRGLEEQASKTFQVAELKRVTHELALLGNPGPRCDEAATVAEDLASEILELRALINSQARLASAVREGERACSLLKRVGCAANILPCPLIDSAVEQRNQGELAKADLHENYASPITLAAELKEKESRRSEALDMFANSNRQLKSEADLRKREKQLQEQIGPTPAHFSDPENFERQRAELRAELSDLQRQLLMHTSAAAAATAVAAEKSKQAEKFWGYCREEEPHVARIRAVSMVERAFHRSGIPRSMLEQALPGIMAELDVLLTRPGLSWLRLSIDYPFGSDPKAVPTVLASVRGAAWVDAALLSGGQRGLARLLVRLAQCLWMSRSVGARVLFLDEPTANTDEGLSVEIGELLRSLVGPGRPFSQGILATHDAALANILGGVQKVGAK